MADSPSINAAQFFRRLQRVQDAWQADINLGDVDVVLVVAGGSDEEMPYKKSTAFQTWMLGYEFPSTLMIMAPSKILFLAGASRTKIVSPLAAEAEKRGLELEILTRGKDVAENEALWANALAGLKGKKVGVFAKDKVKGKFTDEWEAFLAADDRKASYEAIDVSPAVASIMAVKEKEEIASQDAGARASMHVMHYFGDTMLTLIDQNAKMTHEKLAERVEAQLESPKLWKNFKANGLFDPGLAEWCYTPIIQSGGNYDLRPSAQSDDGKLKAGVILCSLGIRYKSYCSNMGRTFFIDPHKSQQDNYAFLCKLQSFVVEQLRNGVQFNAVYQATVDQIQEERPDLLPHFNKSMGFLMGIEFKESSYNLNARCSKTMKTDMILSLNIGFENIPDPKSKGGGVYALLLADTIRVTENASLLLSDGIKSGKEVFFSLDDEANPKANGSGKSAPPKRGGARTQSAVMKTKLRQKDTGQSAQAERRRQHQAELAAKKQLDGELKYKDGAGTGQVKEKQWKRFESYQRENQLPDESRALEICVDSRKQTVILPINGYAVPFHIKSIKNAIKQEEGDYTTIRVMFITPGQLTGKKEDTPFEDIGANFIRALTYRSTDSARFSEVYKEITELRKEATKRENERREAADIVDQEKLVEGRRARLHDTWLRPPFEGKRSTGDVEIHQNGIRWSSKARSDHKLDVTFANIKHLFFQPCDNELVVLVHVHLKSPIMLGKKKVKDVQFYREATDAAFDETGNRKRRRQHEEDEIELEQEERRQRASLNKEFKAFADKIADASNGRCEVDIPFRELAFQGVPFKTNVYLQPTTDSLVHLSELPVLVITLAEIEVAHLERVQYGLKNFDLVFVFTDFTRPPVHINTIPSEDLENVKAWLDSCDIATTEGPLNLQWPQIMKTVNENPGEFFNEGGWSFLQGGEGEGDDSDNPDSDESAFEPGESDIEAHADSDGSDYSGDDMSASDDGGSGSDDGDDASAGYGESEASGSSRPAKSSKKR